MKRIPLTTPGEMLREEFLKPLRISQYKLAKDINVPPIRISEIIRGKRAITPDTALRLEKYFGMSAEFWLNFQARYDLEKQKEILEDRLKVEIKVLRKGANLDQVKRLAYQL